ncbi:condensation domain-containing protein [Streptomyces sp. NPDC004270]
MNSFDVHFTDCAARSGGIAWAQQDIYGFVYGGRNQAGQRSPDLRGTVDPECEPSADDCRSAIRILVSRHEALRTTFTAGDGGFLAQHVADEGTIPVLVGDVDVVGAGREEQAVSRLTDLLTDRQIDVTAELPLRVGLVTASRTVRRIIVVISRMVVDGWGFENLLQDFVREVVAVRRAGGAPPRAFQQLDQWEWERSEQGAMRAKAALSYRSKLLDKSAGSPDPRSVPGTPVGRMRRGGLSLGAEFTASLRQASSSLSTSTSALLLTSCALAASDTLGAADVLLHLHCANRFDPPRIRSVTRLKSMALMPYRRESQVLSAEAKRVWRSALLAYLHAQVPPGVAAEIIRRAENRLLVEFNDRRTLADEVEGDPLGGADLTEYSTSEIDVIDSVRQAVGPHMGFSIDPRGNRLGLSVKLESNVLRDEEIVSTLTRIRESLQKGPVDGEP